MEDSPFSKRNAVSFEFETPEFENDLTLYINDHCRAWSYDVNENILTAVLSRPGSVHG